MKKIILALALFSYVAVADPVITLPKGTPSPYDGVLFSKQDELALRTKVNDADYNAKDNALLKQENEELNQRVQLWMGQSKDLSEQVVKIGHDTVWEKGLWFLGGALITTGLFFAAKQATK